MSLAASLREFFTLESAEKKISAYEPAQAAEIRRLHEAGAAHLAAARELSGRRTAPSAALLLRESCACFLRALAVARDPAAEPDALFAMEALDPSTLSEESRDALRRAFATADTLAYHAMDDRALFAHVRALEDAAAALEPAIETRTALSVRALRYGRRAAVAIAAAWALWTYAVAPHVLPQNIALHKTVTASSRHPGTPDGKDLVDGVVGGTFAIHTLTEESPWVQIDLGQVYVVENVKVHNRGDGWFDDCLPLILELSEDGTTWAEVARRRDHFDQNPPWDVDTRKTKGRYVRLRAARKTYVSLSEVEVYGHP
jgi:hypothetical protein